MADIEIYKITSTNRHGQEVAVYAPTKHKHSVVRMMNEEYGNASVEQVAAEDLPADVKFDSES
jgi:hypothetical protein